MFGGSQEKAAALGSALVARVVAIICLIIGLICLYYGISSCFESNKATVISGMIFTTFGIGALLMAPVLSEIATEASKKD